MTVDEFLRITKSPALEIGFFCVITPCTYVFKIGIYFEKSSDIWPRHRHHNTQNYWSSGEPLLPRYACIYRTSEISSFTVVENVFTLTVRVLTQTAEFFISLFPRDCHNNQNNFFVISGLLRYYDKRENTWMIVHGMVLSFTWAV